MSGGRVNIFYFANVIDFTLQGIGASNKRV